MAVVQVSDVVVPEIFHPYTQQLTEEKSRLVRSGAVVRDPILDANLAGAGLTFSEPSFKDLENTTENISTDDPDQKSTPDKISSATEIQVRMSRNKSWSSMDLAGDLIARDPMEAIANRVSDYWYRREQSAFVAMMKGIFADNDTATDAYHIQGDMTYDVSGASFTDGVTNFSAGAFVDACLTMGDSMEDLSLMMTHSVVYARMLKNNMIDFIPVSINQQAVRIPTFLGRMVTVDDGMPYSGGVFETWLYGRGSIRNGRGSPKMPVEVTRDAAAGNGSGQEIMFNRVEWCLAPKGYAYVGTAPKGGPSNAATANNLAAATSWRRVFSERKQVKIARLKTREF